MSDAVVLMRSANVAMSLSPSLAEQCVPITFPESLSNREVGLEAPSGSSNGSSNRSTVATVQPINGSAAATPVPSTTSVAAASLPSSSLSLVLVGSYLAYYFTSD